MKNDDIFKPKNIMETHISELGFSTHVIKSLSHAKINTLGELMQRTEKEVLGLKGIGKTSLEKIKLVLGILGVSLKKESRDQIINNISKKTSLKDLYFSARLVNALHLAGINTVEELQDKTIDELRSIKNLGEQSLNELIQKCEEYKIILKTQENTKITDKTLLRDTDLTKRIVNILVYNGISTIQDLKNFSIFEMKNIKGIGEKYLGIIIKFGRKHGITFKENSFKSSKTFKKFSKRLKELDELFEKLNKKDITEEERQRILEEISKKQEQIKILERIIKEERKRIRDLEEKLVIATQENQGKGRI